MTIPQYEILVKAHKLKEVDKDYRNHLQAYLGVSAGATKKSGKPVYTKFKQFYDYEKEQEEAKKEKKEDKYRGLKAYLRNKEKEDGREL